MKKVELSEMVLIVMAFRGDNQTDLASRMGVSQATVNKLIKGTPARTAKTVEHYDKIAEYVVDGLMELRKFLGNGKLEKRVRESINPYIEIEQ